MRPVSMDRRQRRPRQQPALRARVLVADCVVIGVEQYAKRGIVEAITRNMRLEHEGLEKPTRMRKMPFDRARIGHRLDCAILRRQWCRQGFGCGADRAIARREGRRMRWLCQVSQGRAVVHGSGVVPKYAELDYRHLRYARNVRRSAARSGAFMWRAFKAGLFCACVTAKSRPIGEGCRAGLKCS